MKTWLCLVLMVPSFASARDFTFEMEYLAPYFRGSSALSTVGKETYGNASGGARIKDEIKYNFAGELGALLSFGQRMALRLGLEVLQTKPLNNVEGKNASGQELLTLTSKTFAMIPKVTVEIYAFRTPTFRLLAYAGMGLADISLDNEYSFTAAGQSQLSISSDYIEKSENSVIMAEAGIGFETLFVDNVTFEMDVGYRHLPVSNLKHKHDITTLQGSFSQGDLVRNDDSTERGFDLSGVYVGMSFRFYVDFSLL